MVRLYSDVPGQPDAVAALRAAAVRPVHAYLLVGPAGTGKRAAALSFAAQLLPGGEAESDDPGHQDLERRVRAGVHPDVVTVEREGPAISIGMAIEVTRVALRSPIEGARKVLVLEDFHLVKEAGPALLKTIEEPPPSTVFVILAEYVPPELVTIASRCVRIDFAPLPPALLVKTLISEGSSPDEAAELAQAAGGRLDRARLLASDPAFALRREAWASVPTELDGEGATAALVSERLLGLLDESIAPLRVRHESELSELERRNSRGLVVNGKVGRSARGGTKAGLRELEDRQKREVRRQRTDELRSGLATLARAYGRKLGAGGPSTRGAIEAIGIIDGLAAAMEHNPNESLAVLALMVRLGRLRSASDA